SEAAMVRLLAGLHDPRAENIYWQRIDVGHPTALRAAALQALGTLPPPTADLKLQKLLVCAADADFQVVAPALMILRHVPVARKSVKHWLRLLEAPDVATRRFAVEKLKGSDSPEVARALLPQLRHPDRTLRDEALAALHASKSGREALFEAALEAETVDEAWFLARSLSESAGELPARARERLVQH